MSGKEIGSWKMQNKPIDITGILSGSIPIQEAEKMNDVGATKRELSHSEKILEESGQQTSQLREIHTRLANIQECLLGSVPANPQKEIPPPMVAGIFGSLYINLYESGRVIENLYDEIRAIEKALGIVAEKHPAERPPRMAGPGQGR